MMLRKAYFFNREKYGYQDLLDQEEMREWEIQDGKSAQHLRRTQGSRSWKRSKTRSKGVTAMFIPRTKVWTPHHSAMQGKGGAFPLCGRQQVQASGTTGNPTKETTSRRVTHGVISPAADRNALPANTLMLNPSRAPAGLDM